MKPEDFKTYEEFFKASGYGVEKCSAMWCEMIATRDKWVEV